MPFSFFDKMPWGSSMFGSGSGAGGMQMPVGGSGAGSMQAQSMGGSSGMNFPFGGSGSSGGMSMPFGGDSGGGGGMSIPGMGGSGGMSMPGMGGSDSSGGGSSGGMNFGEGLLTANEEIYGRKPVVPGLDYFRSYAQTIAENQRLAPLAMALADKTNQYNMDTLSNLYRQVFPNRDATFKNISSSLEARSRGEIPQEVSDQVQRSAAAQALGGGYSGSGMHGNLVARDLGRTGYDIQRQGQEDTSKWLTSLYQTSLPQPVDIRDYSINPAARSTDDWQRNWLAEQVAASPNPAMRGQFDSKMAMAGMVLSAYGGGAGYGGYAQGNQGAQGGGGNAGGGSSNAGWWTRTKQRFGSDPSPSAVQSPGPVSDGWDY